MVVYEVLGMFIIILLCSVFIQVSASDLDISVEEFLDKIGKRLTVKNSFEKDFKCERLPGKPSGNLVTIHLQIFGSEQAFLSLLEGSFELDINGINGLPHCYTTSPLLADRKYKISRSEMGLYSFLDICRYCRGTLSHLLGSGKMHQMLGDFFQKLRVGVDFTGRDMQLLAFSYEKTDI